MLSDAEIARRKGIVDARGFSRVFNDLVMESNAEEFVDDPKHFGWEEL